MKNRLGEPEIRRGPSHRWRTAFGRKDAARLRISLIEWHLCRVRLRLFPASSLPASILMKTISWTTGSPHALENLGRNARRMTEFDRQIREFEAKHGLLPKPILLFGLAPATLSRRTRCKPRSTDLKQRGMFGNTRWWCGCNWSSGACRFASNETGRDHKPRRVHCSSSEPV